MNLFIITYILIIKRNIWSYSSKILKTLVQSSAYYGIFLPTLLFENNLLKIIIFLNISTCFFVCLLESPELLKVWADIASMYILYEVFSCKAASKNHFESMWSLGEICPTLSEVCPTLIFSEAARAPVDQLRSTHVTHTI